MEWPEDSLREVDYERERRILYEDRRRKDGGNIERQGTTDWEARKPTRRIRYTIPLRSKKQIGDEENVVHDSENLQLERGGRLLQNIYHVKGSHHLDIIATHCIPDEDDREIVSLTVADKLGPGGQEKVHSASRWRCSCPQPKHP